MPDLWIDDIQDTAKYPDSMILSDVQALLNAGQREDTVLDYKKDISDKDNWPETAAAFINAYGGLIIFGVEAKGDQPHKLTGFDPRGVETRARLSSTLFSRIQPRPEFQIRVVSLATDKTKELAILRLPEGVHPPYVHTKNHERRVYVRVGSQKAEADHLQLSALFEKRKKIESQAEASFAELTVGSSLLNVSPSLGAIAVHSPGLPPASRHWYRFVIGPDDERAARRLTNDVEQQFKQAGLPGVSY